MRLQHLAIIALLLTVPQFDAVAQNSAQEQAELDGYTRFLSMTKIELKALLAKAESGDAEAQYWVAAGLLDDPEEHEKGEEWLLKSAEGGFAPAQRRYALWHLHTDPAVAQRWLLAAAAQGDGGSEMMLGAAAEDGSFGTTDRQEAIKWYRLAAEEGQVDAQFLLGNRYEKGHGVELNYAKAAEWYRKAALHVLPDNTGADSARYYLALLYMDGRGVQQDYVQAYFLLRLVNQDEYMKMIKPHMTPEQISEGERLVNDWKAQHRLPPEIIAAFHIVETP